MVSMGEKGNFLLEKAVFMTKLKKFNLSNRKSGLFFSVEKLVSVSEKS